MTTKHIYFVKKLYTLENKLESIAIQETNFRSFYKNRSETKNKYCDIAFQSTTIYQDKVRIEKEIDTLLQMVETEYREE